jgi:hypothetical protein
VFNAAVPLFKKFKSKVSLFIQLFSLLVGVVSSVTCVMGVKVSPCEERTEFNRDSSVLIE